MPTYLPGLNHWPMSGSLFGSLRFSVMRLSASAPGLSPTSTVRHGVANGPAFFASVPSGHGISHRSEEHTSELQSLMRISYAVFCLKKKKHHKQLRTVNY